MGSQSGCKRRIPEGEGPEEVECTGGGGVCVRGEVCRRRGVYGRGGVWRGV